MSTIGTGTRPDRNEAGCARITKLIDTTGPALERGTRRYRRSREWLNRCSGIPSFGDSTAMHATQPRRPVPAAVAVDRRRGADDLAEDDRLPADRLGRSAVR